MGGEGFRRFSAVANHSSVANRMADWLEVEVRLSSFLVPETAMVDMSSVRLLSCSFSIAALVDDEVQ